MTNLRWKNDIVLVQNGLLETWWIKLKENSKTLEAEQNNI